MSDDDSHVIAAAMLLARMKGCTCEPDVTIDRPEEGIAYARMAHDEWCPLLMARNAHRN